MKRDKNILKYRDYELEDFLGDTFFIAWAKDPKGDGEHFWEKWIAENPGKRQMVMEAASLIRSVGYQNRPQLSDSAYLEIFENVLRTEPRKESKDRLPKEKTDWRTWLGIQKVAAAVLFAFCAWAVTQVYVISPETEEDPLPVLWEISENPAGVRSTLNMGDGSTISLNASSKLSFPEHFSDTVRLVKLEGEAFFDIEEDGRPFIVDLGNTMVEVMGTTFNVRNPKNGELAVALISGKVKVKDDAGNQVILNPSEMLRFHQNGDRSLTSFDPLEVTGWKNKVLVFRKADKDEIIRKIRDWYGVEVSCDPRIDHSWAYSGEYKNESLENVLKGIKRALGIEYEVKGKQVIIKPRAL
ncbi:FecR family protein [Echinicola vietnamensis]|uniref:Fe2+-dicitrate sensor, membrane component n=1 Tax=Echinicola vietnamensis (strain DSM 17526 / LMG 23754 / KMM 6221) TaxID=926556 RepID=L0G3X2_ECHVK|nr:FecR domain-containing protein [Echinicola vietnamensis]AGA79993.1 Fe2+-dicitrate sensor, membrane component [Echinicola vietnamensis DSM 17526]